MYTTWRLPGDCHLNGLTINWENFSKKNYIVHACTKLKRMKSFIMKILHLNN